MQHKEAELLVNLGLEERAIRDSYDNQAIIACVLVFLCGAGLFVYAKQKRDDMKVQNPRMYEYGRYGHTETLYGTV